MKRVLLAILLCFFVCNPTFAFAKKQIQNLTFSSVEDILPIFPLIYKTWKIDKDTESINKDIKSVSYILSNTVGMVVTGKTTGEVYSITVFATVDKNIDEKEAILNFLEDSTKAVNVIGIMSIKNFIKKEKAELAEKLIEHLSLKNSEILEGKPVDANIKKQGVKLEARFVEGIYFVEADAVD
mgnify:FL=1